MEGLIEISLGLFLSRSLAGIMGAFPMPLLGGMLFMVAIELSKAAVKLRGWKLGLAVTTALFSVVGNMALGFVIGLGLTHLLRALKGRGYFPGILRGEGFLSDD